MTPERRCQHRPAACTLPRYPAPEGKNEKEKEKGIEIKKEFALKMGNKG